MTTRNMRPKPYVVVEFPTDEEEIYAALSGTEYYPDYYVLPSVSYWRFSKTDRYSVRSRELIAYKNIVVTPKGKVLVDVDIPRWLEDANE